MTRDTTHGRRFVANADADPQAYAQYVRNKYGFSPQGVETLLAMEQHLSDGKALEPRHVRLLEQMHPQSPRGEIAEVVQALNEQHPGMRSKLFIAAMASDFDAMRGNFHLAGDAYREVSKLASEYTTQSYADELNRRVGVTAKDRAERPEWKPAPGSTRDIIERQFEPKGSREMKAAVDAGDPHASQFVRNRLADTIERSAAVMERNKEDDDKTSLRDTVAAAFANSHAVEVGTDQGWLPEELGNPE